MPKQSTQSSPVETAKCHYCERDRPKHQLTAYPHGIFCSNNSLNPSDPPCWKEAMTRGTRTITEVNQQNRKSALLAALGTKQTSVAENSSNVSTVPSSVLPASPDIPPVIDKKSAFLARLKG